MSPDRFRYIDDASNGDEEVIVIGPSSGIARPSENGSAAGQVEMHSGQGGEPTLQGGAISGRTVVSEDQDKVSAKGDEASEDEGGVSSSSAPSPSFSGRHAEGEVPSPEDSQSDIKVPFLRMQRIILVVMALLVAGFLIYFLCGCSSEKDESAPSSRATNKMILQYDLSSDKASSVSSKAYDVTGDGKLDKVSFKPELSKGASGSSIHGLTLKVNKKDSLVLSRTEHPELSKADGASLKLLTLSSGQTYLFLSCEGEEGSLLSGVYSIKKGKAQPLVTSYSDADSVWSPVSQMRGSSLAAQATDDHVAVTVDFDCFVTGQTEATFDFVPEGSSLALNTPVASNFGFKASNAQSYDRPSVSAARSFAAYTDESLSSYSFTVASGDACVLESLSVSDDKLKFSVKDGDKSGWFSSPSYGYRTYFQETNEVLE